MIPFSRRSSAAMQQSLVRRFFQNGSHRCFAAKALKYEDLSLEGRYSGALMGVCLEKGNMDKVFDDLSHLRACFEESSDFKLFIQSPAIQPADKEKIFAELQAMYSYDAVTTNYLRCLLENRRLNQLKKMIDNFENFYRAEKGEVMCTVTSVKELSSGEKSKVEKSLAARAQGAKIMVSYNTNDAILGGLVVKMGEQVLDFSVSSRLDRLQAKLLAPV